MTWTSSTLLSAILLALLLMVAIVAVVLLRPTTHTTPGMCTHWALPTGSGSACTETAPCQVKTWTQSADLARPGATLCLMSGVYRKSQGGAIDPLDTIAGTAAAPITVRALHDGQVLIDAEHTGFAVFLQTGNDWWRIEGVNGTNGKEAVFRSRANHVRFIRIIAWNGTSGEADSLGIGMSGPGVDQLCIDCAAWGENMRKIYEFSQSQAPGQDMLGSGCRRCWGEWNDHPEGVSNPNVTYQAGYRSRNQIWENVIGTWRQTGTVGDGEGVFRMFYGCEETDMAAHVRLLGSFFYLRSGTPANLGSLATADCGSHMTWRDVAAVVESEHGTVKPFMFRSGDSLTPEANNLCDNCLGVHAGTPSMNQGGSGFTMPGFREGRTLAEATSGQSVYDILPGLCTRYEGGVLTTKPLWPWPMEERLAAARAMAGAPPVHVTQDVEAMLGNIPDQCRSDRAPIPPEPVPPTPSVAMTCSGDLLAGGKLTMQCHPQEKRR